jgi:hypothetical protein
MTKISVAAESLLVLLMLVCSCERHGSGVLDGAGSEELACPCGFGQPESSRLSSDDGPSWEPCICDRQQSSDDRLCRTATRGVPAGVVLESHEPIILESVQSSADDPVIIEGYEITNPDGPCISTVHVKHVVIRNNHLHDCGTNVSAAVQAAILAGGDVSLATELNRGETGAIHVFNPLQVEVNNNTLENVDYGMVIHAADHRIAGVSVRGNIVESSHRAGAIYVCVADAVSVENNCSRDSGLELFFDNETLAAELEAGQEHTGDGRAWGIIADNCNNVTIKANTVINSSTDGIAVTADETASGNQVFDVAGNVVLRNGEQGIWIVGMRDGRINNNVIWENRARQTEVGGSSGIVLDVGSRDIEIHNNDLAYNDMYGIALQAASTARIHDNEIHHNGDGAIGWGDFHAPGSGFHTAVTDNSIHDNRLQVFGFMTEAVGTVTVDGNTITRVGGQPVHYEDFADHNSVAHPEAWDYSGRSAILPLASEAQKGFFQFGTNTIDGVVVVGSPQQ